IRISDHSRPVLMCTDATLAMLTLISSRLNHDRLRRVTDLSVTSITVRNSRLPRVKRDAWNDSVGIRRALYGSALTHATSAGFVVRGPLQRAASAPRHLSPAGAPDDWKGRITGKPRIRQGQPAQDERRSFRRLDGPGVGAGAAQSRRHPRGISIHVAIMTDPGARSQRDSR